MPAPANTTSGAAVDLGDWPISYTQDANFGGTTYDLWFKFTATRTGMVNLFPYGGGTSYQARATLYGSDATTRAYPPSYTNSVDIPWQFPIVEAETYYVFVVSLNGNVPTAILTITGALPPTTGALPGDLLINDDYEPLYAAILDQDDGSLKQFIPTVQGEFGDILPSGVFALTNENQDVPNPEIVLYNADFTELSRPYTFTGSPSGLRTNGSDLFYFCDTQVSSIVKTVNAAGVVGGTTWTMPELLRTLAPSRDDTILYWAHSGAGEAIRRWDLINDIALSDLAAAPTGHAPVLDILVLENGNIVVTWNKTTSPRNTELREYEPDGTLVNTYPVTFPNDDPGDGPRLAINKDDTSDSFWLWVSGRYSGLSPSYEWFQGRWTELSTADGSTIRTYDQYEYEQGLGIRASADWPTFGNSKSCPFFLLRTTQEAPVITNIPPFPCETADGQTIPIYGTGFGATEGEITVTNPEGDPIAVTINSWTDTLVVITMPVLVCGVWSFVATNADTGVSSEAFTVDTGTAYFMRRVRVFLLPYDQQYNIRISRLELLAQTGVGLTTGQGSDPVVMLRISWDGGFTWGHEQQLSMGKIGEYFRRIYATRLGQGRQPVAEIVVSDPVFCSFLECFVDAEKGTS